MNHTRHPESPLEPQDELARRLTRALETPPTFRIPEGFAARTAAAASRLPQHAPASTTPRFSTLAMRLAFAVLVLAMLLFAPWTHSQSLIAALTETLLALEFVVLTTWLSLRPQAPR